MTDQHHSDPDVTADVAPVDMEDPLATPTWVVGIIGGVIVIAIVLGVAGLLYDLLGARQESVVLEATQGSPVDRLNEASLARLDGPARREMRTDSPEGGASIVIPIEDAMRLVIEESD